MTYKYNINKKLVTTWQPLKGCEDKLVNLTDEQANDCIGFDNQNKPVYKDKSIETKLKRKNEIILELDNIDRKSIRPMRAGETSKLAELESKAQALRTELATL
jgi:hypothetical protein